MQSTLANPVWEIGLDGGVNMAGSITTSRFPFSLLCFCFCFAVDTCTQLSCIPLHRTRLQTATVCLRRTPVYPLNLTDKDLPARAASFPLPAALGIRFTISATGFALAIVFP